MKAKYHKIVGLSRDDIVKEYGYLGRVKLSEEGEMIRVDCFSDEMDCSFSIATYSDLVLNKDKHLAYHASMLRFYVLDAIYRDYV